ncbi:MAG: molecular chaperone HtpG [Bacteroidales bacterium]|nr:molecular chaperone HtpG [Bacteroidales bacterium]
MQKGSIGVTSDNIFPIIKQFLYSDQEIFLRELVSNAVDATQKLKTLASVGEFQGELGDLTIKVSLDKKAKTITVSDRGIGMTDKEIDKYINQIAFSSAGEFVKKYKDKSSVIGHFGLGFYSSFMVSEKVEIITKSHKRGKAVKWSCNGDPEYTIEEHDRKERGTDIVLHIDKESKEFLEEARIEGLLKKYCKYLPIEIAFGEEKEWKDGKEVETGNPKIINNVKPAWTVKPADLKEEDYKKFYEELYPYSEEPLFNIHLNVDFPFNLTGILYFPKIKNNIEVQKNKIQLYSNQVYVTDSVEGIVPDFLTLLHGVLDSPDIPLNVSRSYLQSDSNVKKISGHITKKVADRLADIFKNSRDDFEKKWDSLKLFIAYGMLTEEKFHERAIKFALLKNTEGKYFTFDEYKELVGSSQKNKHDDVIYLYTTNPEEQYSFVEAARNKGYDVLIMDGHLDSHFINHLEQKLEKVRFVRVDGDVVDKLIEKDEKLDSKLSEKETGELKHVFLGQIAKEQHYSVVFEAMKEDNPPAIITQSEYMRRMKEMAKMGGGGMNFYGELPDSYNIVVNTNHPLIEKIASDKNNILGKDLEEIESEKNPFMEEKNMLEESHKSMKYEDIPQAEKDRLEELRKNITEIDSKKEEKLKEYSNSNPLVKQIIDLAMLSNNMLKGEDLDKFVKRSIGLL